LLKRGFCEAKIVSGEGFWHSTFLHEGEKGGWVQKKGVSVLGKIIVKRGRKTFILLLRVGIS